MAREKRNTADLCFGSQARTEGYCSSRGQSGNRKTSPERKRHELACELNNVEEKHQRRLKENLHIFLKRRRDGVGAVIRAREKRRKRERNESGPADASHRRCAQGARCWLPFLQRNTSVHASHEPESHPGQAAGLSSTLTGTRTPKVSRLLRLRPPAGT